MSGDSCEDNRLCSHLAAVAKCSEEAGQPDGQEEGGEDNSGHVGWCLCLGPSVCAPTLWRGGSIYLSTLGRRCWVTSVSTRPGHDSLRISPSLHPNTKQQGGKSHVGTTPGFWVTSPYMCTGLLENVGLLEYQISHRVVLGGLQLYEKQSYQWEERELANIPSVLMRVNILLAAGWENKIMMVRSRRGETNHTNYKVLNYSPEGQHVTNNFAVTDFLIKSDNWTL